MEKHPFQPGVDLVSTTNRQLWLTERAVRWQLDHTRLTERETGQFEEEIEDLNERVGTLRNEIHRNIHQDFCQVQNSPMGGKHRRSTLITPSTKLVNDTFLYQQKLVNDYAEDQELLTRADTAFSPSLGEKLWGKAFASPHRGLATTIDLASAAAPEGHTRVRLLVEMHWLERYHDSLGGEAAYSAINRKVPVSNLSITEKELIRSRAVKQARFNYCIRDRIDEEGLDLLRRDHIRHSLKVYQEEREELERWLKITEAIPTNLRMKAWNAIASLFGKEAIVPPPLAFKPVLARWTPPAL